MMQPRFIITGHGRSGTLWLARLLDKCDPSVLVHHEPLGQFDAARYARVYDGTLDAAKFVRQRRPRMERIWQRHPDDGYAEVNSYLRYCVPALRDAFPDTPILAIVRDGRFVVRSMLARGCYRREGYPPIEPPDEMTFDDPVSVIDSCTPFGQCCWYWADTYRRLAVSDVKCYKLEILNRNYVEFYHLCERVGITPDHATWLAHAGKRANVGVADEEPPVWTFDEVEMFARVAGDVQEWFGYPMEGK